MYRKDKICTSPPLPLSNRIKRYIRVCHDFDVRDAIDRGVIEEDVLPKLRQERAVLSKTLWAETRYSHTSSEAQRKRMMDAILTLKSAIRVAKQTLNGAQS